MSDEHEQIQRRPGHLYDPAAPLPDHLRPPAAPEVRSRLKDVDSAEQAFRIRAFANAGWLGILGMFVGLLLHDLYGLNLLLSVALGFAAGTAMAGLLGLRMAHVAGSIARTVYMPSGSSTPPARQYSLGDSLVARGRLREARAEYERAAAAHPRDPEPCLRLARLLRDRLDDPHAAIEWFRQATARRDCDRGTQIMASREIIEVYTHRLREPARALPDLARLADRHADTPAAEWARREMGEIRRQMREQDAR